MQPAVALRCVGKDFGAKTVVDDLSFSVRAGQCFGLLGPNGAGKSTTLKMICGLIRPTRGAVLVGGADAARAPRRTRAMLGIAPQEDVLDSELSVGQNLGFHARYHGLPAAESRRRCAALLADAGLEAHAGDPVSHLSSGLRRRLVLARALLTEPSIVVLDEPTRGLDHESSQRFLRTLTALKGRGATLLLATHDLGEAEALCDRAALMERGRLRAEGSLWDVLQLFRADLPAPPAAEAAC